MSSEKARHLDVAGLQGCIETAVPIEFPVDGAPVVRIFVDPSTPALGLRCPDDGTVVASELEYLRVRTVQRDGIRWQEVLIVHPELFLDGYPVLCAIADRLQLQGMSFASAVADTLRTVGRLLRRLDRLGEEHELGLLGELLFLHGLCVTVGPSEAVQSWVGSESEEHDFGVRGVDLEVKTTRSERPAHWISSLTQLEPSPGRQLWLVSHRLTAAADGGFTLASVIDNVRAAIGDDPARAALEARLHDAGWRESQASAPLARWRLRASSNAYLVDDDFPRITGSMLELAGARLTHITDVRYRLDLTGLSPGSPPEFVLAALGKEISE